MVFRVMMFSLISNIILTSLKIVGGILGNSKTLIANGIHSLSDLATDIVALIGNKFAMLPPDKTHPYGHGKYEYATSIIISFMIIMLSFVICYTSITGGTSIPKNFTLIIIVFCLLVKTIIAFFILDKGKKSNNQILITSGIESKYDALSSLFALVFICLSKYSESIYILKYVDIIGGIFIAALVFKIGVASLKENFRNLVGEVDHDNEKLIEIESKLKENEKIESVEKIQMFKYGSYYMAIIEVNVDGERDLNSLRSIENEIEHALLNFKFIKHINVIFKPKEKQINQ